MTRNRDGREEGEKRGSWEGIWEIIVWDQRCVRNRKDGGGNGVKDFTERRHEKGRRKGRWMKGQKVLFNGCSVHRRLKNTSVLLQLGSYFDSRGHPSVYNIAEEGQIGRETRAGRRSRRF